MPAEAACERAVSRPRLLKPVVEPPALVGFRAAAVLLLLGSLCEADLGK
jgi:hypothetical protein